MKIRIILDGRIKGETEKGFPIVVAISQNYKLKKLRTGFFSKKKHWDASLAEPKPQHPDYYLISDYLEAIKPNVKEAILKGTLNHISIDRAAGIIFKKKYGSFYEAALKTLPDTDSHTDTRNSALRSFNSYFPDLPLHEITPFTAEAFKQKLLEKGNRPGGIDSYFRSLRALWNKVTELPNPFSGHKITIPEKINRVATTGDLKKLKDADLLYTETTGGPGQYRDYWLLMFYLGGIDSEALAKLRYDNHVVGNRIQFNRNKGGSAVACNNIIPDQARKILARYDCKPYLVPWFKNSNYKTFQKNFNRRFQKVCEDMELSVKLRPKSARYTFIDRAQQLLIDERITAQIVGHKRKTTTSIYTNDFPLQVQDEAHLKVVSI